MGIIYMYRVSNKDARNLQPTFIQARAATAVLSYLPKALFG
jgi:hypothetical protein